MSQELEELQAVEAQKRTEAQENLVKRRAVEKKIEVQRRCRNKILQERTNSYVELEDTVTKASERLLNEVENIQV